MESVSAGAISGRGGTTRRRQPWREFLYGDPGRSVPALGLCAAALVGLAGRSPRLFLASGAAVLGAWSLAAPRLVIEDQSLGPVKIRCRQRDRSGRPLVWLTFDDGPSVHTEAVLEILRQEQGIATFFLVGERLLAWSDPERLGQRLLEGGHSIGNHTWSHPNLLTVSLSELTQQIATTDEILAPLRSPGSPNLFRPPFGYRNRELFPVLERRGAEAVGWSVNSLDFLGLSAERIVERVMERIHPGAIVLLHDGPEGREETVRALPELIRRIRGAGYRFYSPTDEELL